MINRFPIFAFSAMLLGVPFSSSQGEIIDRIVASVNGQIFCKAIGMMLFAMKPSAAAVPWIA